MDKFKKIYSYLSGTNFAYLLVLAVVIKSVVSDISYAAFLVTIPVLAFEGYKLFLKSKKPDAIIINTEIQKQLDNIHAKVNANQMDQTLTKPMKRYF